MQGLTWWLLACLVVRALAHSALQMQPKQFTVANATKALALEHRMQATSYVAHLMVRDFAYTGDASSCEQPHRADAICRWAAADKGWGRLTQAEAMASSAALSYAEAEYDEAIIALEESLAMRLFAYTDQKTLDRWQQGLVMPGRQFRHEKRLLADNLVLHSDCLMQLAQVNRDLGELSEALQLLQLATALLEGCDELLPSSVAAISQRISSIAALSAELLAQLKPQRLEELLQQRGVACSVSSSSMAKASKAAAANSNSNSSSAALAALPSCGSHADMLLQLVPLLRLPVRLLAPNGTPLLLPPASAQPQQQQQQQAGLEPGQLPRAAPLPDAFATHGTAMLQRPCERVPAYMQRTFFRLMGLVPADYMRELAVPCQQQDGKGRCISYLPAWVVAQAVTLDKATGRAHVSGPAPTAAAAEEEPAGCQQQQQQRGGTAATGATSQAGLEVCGFLHMSALPQGAVAPPSSAGDGVLSPEQLQRLVQHATGAVQQPGKKQRGGSASAGAQQAVYTRFYADVPAIVDDIFHLPDAADATLLLQQLDGLTGAHALSVAGVASLAPPAGCSEGSLLEGGAPAGCSVLIPNLGSCAATLLKQPHRQGSGTNAGTSHPHPPSFKAPLRSSASPAAAIEATACTSAAASCAAAAAATSGSGSSKASGASSGQAGGKCQQGSDGSCKAAAGSSSSSSTSCSRPASSDSCAEEEEDDDDGSGSGSSSGRRRRRKRAGSGAGRSKQQKQSQQQQQQDLYFDHPYAHLHQAFARADRELSDRQLVEQMNKLVRDASRRDKDGPLVPLTLAGAALASVGLYLAGRRRRRLFSTTSVASSGIASAPAGVLAWLAPQRSSSGGASGACAGAQLSCPAAVAAAAAAAAAGAGGGVGGPGSSGGSFTSTSSGALGVAGRRGSDASAAAAPGVSDGGAAAAAAAAAVAAAADRGALLQKAAIYALRSAMSSKDIAAHEGALRLAAAAELGDTALVRQVAAALDKRRKKAAAEKARELAKQQELAKREKKEERKKEAAAHRSSGSSNKAGSSAQPAPAAAAAASDPAPVAAVATPPPPLPGRFKKLLSLLAPKRGGKKGPGAGAVGAPGPEAAAPADGSSSPGTASAAGSASGGTSLVSSRASSSATLGSSASTAPGALPGVSSGSVGGAASPQSSGDLSLSPRDGRSKQRAATSSTNTSTSSPQSCAGDDADARPVRDASPDCRAAAPVAARRPPGSSAASRGTSASTNSSTTTTTVPPAVASKKGSKPAKVNASQQQQAKAVQQAQAPPPKQPRMAADAASKAKGAKPVAAVKPGKAGKGVQQQASGRGSAPATVTIVADAFDVPAAAGQHRQQRQHAGEAAGSDRGVLPPATPSTGAPAGGTGAAGHRTSRAAGAPHVLPGHTPPRQQQSASAAGTAVARASWLEAASGLRHRGAASASEDGTASTASSSLNSPAGLAQHAGRVGGSLSTPTKKLNPKAAPYNPVANSPVSWSSPASAAAAAGFAHSSAAGSFLTTPSPAGSAAHRGISSGGSTSQLQQQGAASGIAGVASMLLQQGSSAGSSQVQQRVSCSGVVEPSGVGGPLLPPQQRLSGGMQQGALHLGSPHGHLPGQLLSSPSGDGGGLYMPSPGAYDAAAAHAAMMHQELHGRGQLSPRDAAAAAAAAQHSWQQQQMLLDMLSAVGPGEAAALHHSLHAGSSSAPVAGQNSAFSSHDSLAALLAGGHDGSGGGFGDASSYGSAAPATSQALANLSGGAALSSLSVPPGFEASLAQARQQQQGYGASSSSTPGGRLPPRLAIPGLDDMQLPPGFSSDSLPPHGQQLQVPTPGTASTGLTPHSAVHTPGSLASPAVAAQGAAGAGAAVSAGMGLSASSKWSYVPPQGKPTVGPLLIVSEAAVSAPALPVDLYPDTGSSSMSNQGACSTAAAAGSGSDSRHYQYQQAHTGASHAVHQLHAHMLSGGARHHHQAHHRHSLAAHGGVAVGGGGGSGGGGGELDVMVAAAAMSANVAELVLGSSPPPAAAGMFNRAPNVSTGDADDQMARLAHEMMAGMLD